MSAAERMSTARGLAAASLALVLAMVLAGCGLSIPVDPDGTLDRVTGGVLRAGASADGALVMVTGGSGEVDGVLPDLVERFAASRDARVEWVVASEEDLVDDLESGELDLAVGGMTERTPWAERVSVTRAYRDIPGADGAPVVMLLPLGENALQSALEAYLDREVGR